VADEQAGRRFHLSWRRRTSSRARRSAQASACDWRDTLRSRLMVAAICSGLWTAAIEARLLYLQVFEHRDMVALAARQRENTIEPAARRGDIVDRNGNLLAYTVDADSIIADPTEIDDVNAVAASICGALDHCDANDRRSIAKSLRRDGQFAWVARKVSPDETRRVRALDLKGIGFVKESQRFYPKRELLSHVLGYVGLDNAGLGGLEASFQGEICGKNGRLHIQRDAKRRVLTSRVEREATAGASLELTIDQYLQNLVERELQAGVEEFGAIGGSIVIMDPATGEILALANAPTFNPNAYSRFSETARRNRAIQDLYEPGSTFKIVTASAALEEGLITPEDLLDVSAGMWRYGSRQVDDVHRYGVLTFTDVIVKSSNVGAIKVGLRLGPERLGRYVSRFGFGQANLPDFRGENAGIVWNPAKLDPGAVASVSMGYQVGVTPVQMVTAVSSIANGGTLFEPRVVRAIIRDGQRIAVPRKALRRTISERTASQMTAIMEAVVEEGTGKSARISGYTVAGKTGTAHKVINGGYSPSEYNASFVGFVPSRKPELAIIVVIDSPHGKGYMGGAVAAPIFKRVAEASLRHLGIAPTVNAPPPVLVAHGVDEDVPPIVPVVNGGSNTRVERTRVDDGLMPNLAGMSARDATRVLTSLGMTSRPNGAGFVLEQSPAAGTVLVPGTACVLTLGRLPARAGASAGAAQ
jgi:cell division protein FtsI (penicillin-binding protein 3)